MSTDCLFREDSYLKDCSATVVGLTERAASCSIAPSSTPHQAGSPATRGTLRSANGDGIRIESAAYVDREKTEIAHLPAAASGASI